MFIHILFIESRQHCVDIDENFSTLDTGGILGNFNAGDGVQKGNVMVQSYQS